MTYKKVINEIKFEIKHINMQRSAFLKSSNLKFCHSQISFEMFFDPKRCKRCFHKYPYACGWSLKTALSNDAKLHATGLFGVDLFPYTDHWNSR